MKSKHSLQSFEVIRFLLCNRPLCEYSHLFTNFPNSKDSYHLEDLSTFVHLFLGT